MTQIYDFLAPALGIGGGVALALLIVFLLLGPTKRFWVFLVYVCWEMIASVGLTLADLHYNGTSQVTSDAGKIYARLYWTNDVIVDLLRFVLIAVLIYQVVGSSKPQFARGLSGLVIVMIVLPFVLFQPIFPAARSLTLFPARYPRAAWFNSTSQLLNFGAAIMNVVLWGVLIQTKKRDPQILAISVGLGILVTGTAISLGLRHFSPSGEMTAAFNLFINLSQLAATLIWCRAFWPVSRDAPPGTVVLSQ